MQSHEYQWMDQLYRSRMREFHLFAGGGGGILGGCILGHWPVGAVEINPYCQKVLQQRQQDKVLPWFPIWNNVKTFNGNPWKGKVDIVSAGFPCQPYSKTGKKQGHSDERNLWPETIRIIREMGPPIAFLENVPDLLLHDYFGTILGDLAECGFDAEWEVISAASVGCRHLRERLWIFAYSNSKRGIECLEQCRKSFEVFNQNWSKKIWQQNRTSFELVAGKVAPTEWRETGNEVDSKSFFLRNRNGLANGVDRLKAIGNGQVPSVVAKAFVVLANKALANV